MIKIGTIFSKKKNRNGDKRQIDFSELESGLNDLDNLDSWSQQQEIVRRFIGNPLHLRPLPLPTQD